MDATQSVATAVAALCGGAAGYAVASRRSQPRAANVVILAATSAASAAAFFITRGRVAERQRASAADSSRTRVMSTMAGGAVGGAVFGAGAVRTPTGAGACLIGGAVCGCAYEIARGQFMQWRLEQLLEERHPELKADNKHTSPTESVVAGNRPWFWPEWAPLQPTDAWTREGELNSEVDRLMAEIAAMDERIDAMTGTVGKNEGSSA